MDSPVGTVYEARLAHRGLAREAVTVEELEAQGWTRAGEEPRYGSTWMVRPVQPEGAR